MRRLFSSWSFWLLLLLLGAAGGGAYAYRRRAQIPEAPPATVKVERGDLEVKYAEAGEVVPEALVLVRTPVAGTVVKLAISEGLKVKKRQLLAVVQPGRSKAERFLPVEIYAPIEGTVLERFIQEGETVAETGDQSRLLSLTDMGRMEVLLGVNEVDILKVRPGMPARLTLDALPGENFQGEVRFVSPGVKGQREGDRRDPQRGVKTFDVRVSLSKPDSRFRPGMTVRVELQIEKLAGVLKVPLSAVEEEAGKARVFLPGTPPQARPVILGLRGDMEAEVREGLQEGEAILEQRPDEKEGPGRRRRAGLSSRTH